MTGAAPGWQSTLCKAHGAGKVSDLSDPSDDWYTASSVPCSFEFPEVMAIWGAGIPGYSARSPSPALQKKGKPRNGVSLF